ncbi:MAG TPA: Vps62-related protein [Bacteroidia bacterium]|nr:Vps62-related protein [Bacteroidia bacterium]
MNTSKMDFTDPGYNQREVMAGLKPALPMPQLKDLELMIKRFAPVISFCSEDELIPVNAEFYLQKSWLVNSVSKNKITAGLTGFPGLSENGNPYYLEPLENITLRQLPAKTYVHAKPYKEIYTDLQYWFLYNGRNSATASVKWLIDETIKGYEGTVNLDPLGKLCGAWERITVRVNNDTGEAEQVYFPQHGKGVWRPIGQVQRRGTQVLVYAAKGSGTFFPDAGMNTPEKVRFNLYSSQLDFCIRHETGNAAEINFSKSCELISADYLRENKPGEPFWLNFRQHWGNPNPDHLSVSVIKRLVPVMFGKSLEFLLSKDLLDELVTYLLLYFTQEAKTASLAPKSRKCWQGEETD